MTERSSDLAAAYSALCGIQARMECGELTINGEEERETRASPLPQNLTPKAAFNSYFQCGQSQFFFFSLGKGSSTEDRLIVTNRAY